jgi:hypothetical protein
LWRKKIQLRPFWQKQVLQEIEVTPPGVLSSRGIEPSVSGDVTHKTHFFPLSPWLQSSK